MLGTISSALGFMVMFIARQLGVDDRTSAVLMLLAMAVFWLLIPLMDWIWFKFKLPGTFRGTNVWKGKWTSSVHSSAYGRLHAIFPEGYRNTGSFTADALLYTSIRAPATPGTFRRIDITGEIDSSVAGNALIASTPKVDSYEVKYNALVSLHGNQKRRI